MKLIIKKFNIKHDGTLYGPGEIIEVENDVAEMLIATGNVVVYAELARVVQQEATTAREKETKAVQSTLEQEAAIEKMDTAIILDKEGAINPDNNPDDESDDPGQLPDINLGATVKAIVPKAAATKNKPRPNAKAGSKK